MIRTPASGRFPHIALVSVVRHGSTGAGGSSSGASGSNSEVSSRGQALTQRLRCPTDLIEMWLPRAGSDVGGPGRLSASGSRCPRWRTGGVSSPTPEQPDRDLAVESAGRAGAALLSGSACTSAAARRRERSWLSRSPLRDPDHRRRHHRRVDVLPHLRLPDPLDTAGRRTDAFAALARTPARKALIRRGRQRRRGCPRGR